MPNLSFHSGLRKALPVLSAVAVLNEIRGVVLAAPVLYGLAVNGSTLMAVWVAFCSLAGIALSVVIPRYIQRRLS